jgi:predicted deacylase
LAFGINHILLDRGRPTDPAKSLYCSTTAITRGKPAITVESGYLGTTDAASVAAIVSGIHGVLRHLGMVESGPSPVARPVYLDPNAVVMSPATGILYPRVTRNETVSKGAILAEITDFFGNPIAKVRSPLDGLVLYIVTTPPITKGQPIGCVATPRV